MINIVQANLNRSRNAHELLTQLTYDEKADLLILSEQYQDRTSTTWFSDKLGTAAIWVTNINKVPAESHGAGEGYVWVKSGKITFVSCYLTPNEPIKDFQTKLDNIEEMLQDTEEEIVIAGDFNAKALEWALEWGMAYMDPRGKKVMEMAARRGLVVLNTGQTTFRRPGQRETIPDISLVTENLVRRAQAWRVMDDYTGSDHLYINFRIQMSLEKERHKATKQEHKWNAAKMDKEKLTSTLIRGQDAVAEMAQEDTGRVVEITMQLKIRDEVDKDPWGLGYKIVTRKLGRLTSVGLRDAGKMENIVGTLFPTH
ncbi:uncharacterized protein LOC117180435 [Belonocnema kinseyi]|uniref:uncharacterized protein LOC117180435 n=1 Tax=Belonocnema kinseyi TaxID=2817044 RepID=UPI00143DF823|nr:uncharacterized protein LOC117180435 [Belonocnema kinseyi]